MMLNTKVNKQKGQATTEYIVVAIMLVAALLAPFPGQNGKSVTEMLVDAIKAEYKAYKYANSVGVIPY